jgi:membrane protease YdiL (CAAX protease family)
MPLARPLGITIAVTASVVLLSYLLPVDWQSTGVGLCLLIATYGLVLRHDASTIRRHGLSLGGVFEPVPLSARRLAAAVGTSLLWCLLAAVIFFPPFWAAFVAFWHPLRDFDAPPAPPLDSVLTQLLGIAMPEEMFYRGYAQSALDEAFKWRFQLFGATLGAGILVSSAVFALGHFATSANPARLSVFFPSLVFGWLRARSGGIGSAVLFHAACNIFSAYLSDGYFGH